jgi:hypothetical protein
MARRGRLAELGTVTSHPSDFCNPNLLQVHPTAHGGANGSGHAIVLNSFLDVISIPGTHSIAKYSS